ncbi:hypothetical protein F4778DRAFT_776055 [Xylariomycetidae sp. FL2044]|nr:hypothetical protein F4778DRAFT_776055 [Xylariomycetidae sp. FL2044]
MLRKALIAGSVLSRVFPSGMKALADEIHGLGLKIGLYGCAGVRTCAGYLGSWGHEAAERCCR